MLLSCENNALLTPQQHQQQQQLHNIQSRSPSSEEDNSPTEMNNCRRLMDKPPLVCLFIFIKQYIMCQYALNRMYFCYSYTYIPIIIICLLCFRHVCAIGINLINLIIHICFVEQFSSVPHSFALK